MVNNATINTDMQIFFQDPVFNSFDIYCYGLNVPILPNSYVEILILMLWCLEMEPLGGN